MSIFDLRASQLWDEGLDLGYVRLDSLGAGLSGFRPHSVGGLYFGESSLGETGDFLSGWLTPLAFFWFVVAVFLQRAELEQQRKELELMRAEYAHSRKAAEDQASHLKDSSLVAARQLFMKMLEDAKEAMIYNVYTIHNRLARDAGNLLLAQTMPLRQRQR